MFDRVLYKVLGGVRFARRQGVKVGSGCRILTSRFGSEPWLVSIGSRVTVSSEVLFVNHDGAGWLHEDERGRRFRYARIEIGDSCFIGARTILLPGVKVGSRCVVGAGSVVTKSIPSGSVVAGNPARFICSYDDLMLRMNAWKASSDRVGDGYVQLVESILDSEFKPEINTGDRDVH